MWLAINMLLPVGLCPGRAGLLIRHHGIGIIHTGVDVSSQLLLAFWQIPIRWRSPAARSIVNRAAGFAPMASYGSCERYALIQACNPASPFSTDPRPSNNTGRGASPSPN